MLLACLQCAARLRFLALTFRRPSPAWARPVCASGCNGDRVRQRDGVVPASSLKILHVEEVCLRAARSQTSAGCGSRATSQVASCNSRPRSAPCMRLARFVTFFKWFPSRSHLLFAPLTAGPRPARQPPGQQLKSLAPQFALRLRTLRHTSFCSPFSSSWPSSK